MVGLLPHPLLQDIGGDLGLISTSDWSHGWTRTGWRVGRISRSTEVEEEDMLLDFDVVHWAAFVAAVVVVVRRGVGAQVGRD